MSCAHIGGEESWPKLLDKLKNHKGSCQNVVKLVSDISFRTYHISNDVTKNNHVMFPIDLSRVYISLTIDPHLQIKYTYTHKSLAHSSYLAHTDWMDSYISSPSHCCPFTLSPKSKTLEETNITLEECVMEISRMSAAKVEIDCQLMATEWKAWRTYFPRRRHLSAHARLLTATWRRRTVGAWRMLIARPSKPAPYI